MNCDEFNLLRADLLYGELGTEQSAACREHLTHCAACRDEFESIAGVRERLAMLPEQRVDPDLSRLLARVLADQRRSRKRWAWSAALAVAAAIALALLLPVHWELGGDHLLVRWKGPSATGEVAKDESRENITQPPPAGEGFSNYFRLRQQVLRGEEIATPTGSNVSPREPLLYGDWRRDLPMLERAL